MSVFRTFLLCTMAMCAICATPTPSQSNAQDRSEMLIELQATMQRFIDRNLVDGAFASIDFEDGTLVRYFPAKADTRILKGKGYFVLCSDMRDSKGNSVPVDYYMAKSDRGYRVIRTEIANRQPLKNLMKTGKLKKF